MLPACLFFQRRDVNLGMGKATLDKILRLLQKRKDHVGPWMLKDSAIRDDLAVTDSVNAEKFHIDIRAPSIVPSIYSLTTSRQSSRIQR